MDDHTAIKDSCAAEGPEREVPVCPHCLTPFSELQYYCENCGQSVGQLTGIIPFVNARFLANFYAKAWHTFRQKDGASVFMRFVCFIVVLMCLPMFVFGLPFVVWEKLRRKSPN